MPPNELAAALLAAGRTPSPEARSAVYAALLEAEVLVALDPDADAAGPAVLVERDAPGGPALLLFSRPETLALWGGSDVSARGGARELLAGAVAQGLERVIVDRAGPVAVTLSSWEVRRLAAGETPGPDAGSHLDEHLAIAVPGEPLGELPAALARALEPHPETLAAAVLEADPVRGRRHLLVAIRLDRDRHPDAGLEPLVDLLHPVLEPAAPDHALLNYAELVDAEPLASLEAAATVWRRQDRV